MRKKPQNQKGYIALIAVIIIVAVTLAIGLSLNILSIGETQLGLSKQQSAQSSALADACLEEAFLRIKRDNNYAGGNLNVGQGSCTITIARQGQRRTVTASSDVNNVMRRLESRITLSGGNIVFDYWRELN